MQIPWFLVVLLRHPCHLDSYYVPPLISAPLGSSDLNSILWSPRNYEKGNNHCVRKPMRRFPESGKSSFGLWAGHKNWFSDCGTNPTADELAVSLIFDVTQSMSLHFPIKYVKCHPTDKPWITPQIKQLIKERQVAFHSGDTNLWRRLRFKVKSEIGKSKKNFYADKVCRLKHSDARKWWSLVNRMTGRKSNSDSVLSIQADNKTLQGSELAEYLNKLYVSVNADIPPLDLSLLPAYLPVVNIPTIQPYEVCQKLLKLKSNKAAGPDKLSARILREFAYEFALPVTEIFNLSHSTGTVPSIWKD